MSLKRRTALVTGANGGIGRKIIEKFTHEGCDVIACLRKENEEFLQFASELKKKYSVKIEEIYFDLTDRETMKTVITDLLKQEEHIDILINNAGIAHGGFFSMTKIDDIRKVFEVNLFSAMELTQLVLRKMTRQKSGVIINVSSVAAFNIRPGNSAYGLSKAALKMWTEILAMEVASLGIRVNAVAPGLTDTKMAKLMEEKAGKEMLNASPMKRLAKPEEIADAVLYLSSDSASFVNGHTLVLNGGGD